MNTEQGNLIQASWKLLTHNPNPNCAKDFVANFYETVFRLDPACKLLFGDDMIEQGETLLNMLDVVVTNIHEIGTIAGAVQELGVRHKEYGVKNYMYFIVGRALMATFVSTLGDDFTDNMCDAWLVAYPFLSNVMTTAAGRGVNQESLREMINPNNITTTKFECTLDKRSESMNFPSSPSQNALNLLTA
eukprot:Pgem_evm1s6522